MSTNNYGPLEANDYQEGENTQVLPRLECVDTLKADLRKWQTLALDNAKKVYDLKNRLRLIHAASQENLPNA